MAAQVLMNFKLSFFFLCAVHKINPVCIDIVVSLFMFTVAIADFFVFEVSNSLQILYFLFTRSNDYQQR